MRKLIDARKDVGLEVSVDKTKYMLISRDHNEGQNRDIKIGNRSFRYMGTTVTNQKSNQDEIKKRVNSGNAYYNSVQKCLSSRLPMKNIKIRTYKTIILPVVQYGCETSSLTLREED
jgi:hypothetical protein